MGTSKKKKLFFETTFHTPTFTTLNSSWTTRFRYAHSLRFYLHHKRHSPLYHSAPFFSLIFSFSGGDRRPPPGSPPPRSKFHFPPFSHFPFFFPPLFLKKPPPPPFKKKKKKKKKS